MTYAAITPEDIANATDARTPEEKAAVDAQYRRNDALDYATRLITPAGRSPEELVAHAKIIEAYLKGE